LLLKNISKKKIKKLLVFIEFYISFEKQEFSRKFEHQIYKIQKPMGIEEIIKEKLLQDAEEKGMEKGMEKGVEKGITIAVTQMLDKGFKPKTIAEILEIDHKLVLKIQRQKKKK
jgi:predicted transposase YdaD